MKRTLALMLGILPRAVSLFANDEIPQKIQVTKTEWGIRGNVNTIPG